VPYLLVQRALSNRGHYVPGHYLQSGSCSGMVVSLPFLELFTEPRLKKSNKDTLYNMMFPSSVINNPLRRNYINQLDESSSYCTILTNPAVTCHATLCCHQNMCFVTYYEVCHLQNLSHNGRKSKFSSTFAKSLLMCQKEFLYWSANAF
jgi:hypothetical protein